MPASMISADSGESVEVIGNSMAIVASGPIPGRTPIRVPRLTPMKQTNSEVGVSDCCSPSRMPFQTSMRRLRNPRGYGSSRELNNSTVRPMP